MARTEKDFGRNTFIIDGFLETHSAVYFINN